LKLVFEHAEVVKCDISATASTLKSRTSVQGAIMIQNQIFKLA
jgi:hypothetical protein